MPNKGRRRQRGKKRSSIGGGGVEGGRSAGKPVRTRDGNFYYNSVKIRNPQSAGGLKPPMDFASNPAAQSNFNQMAYYRYNHGLLKMPRLTAFYRPREKSKGQFCLR